jgi:hypothetical protein
VKFQRLPNGNLLIPVGEYADGIYTDYLEEITPHDPRYQEWVAFFGTEWEEPYVEEAPIATFEPAQAQS